MHTQADEVGLETAQTLLGIQSIDREFEALKKGTAHKQFSYNSAITKQKLRPYQAQAFANLQTLMESGVDTMALQLPTGAGKTFLIHSFIYKNLLKKNKNVLVIVPSWEIANQHAMTVCQQFKDGRSRVCRLGGRGQLISVFTEFGSRMKGKVIITTSALFYARHEKLRISLKSAGLVVIDEGHHGWKKKRLNSIHAFARDIGAPSVLMTATPPRNMENLPFAAQLRYLDLVPEYLVKCDIVRLDTGEEFKPELKNGVLGQRSRVEISSREKRYEKIVSDSLPHIVGQTIYYAGSVREAMGVIGEFAKHGLKAAVVHSKWEGKADKINALAIEKFRKGEVQVLVNVQMLAMGFDVPNVETIIVARPVESDTLFTQMVGRGARASNGKDRFILIDVHDTIFKPEVAKIFEHKHIFYADVDHTKLEQQKRAAPAPVLVLAPARELDLRRFPFSEGQTDDRTLVTEAFELSGPAVDVENEIITSVVRAAWRP